MITCTDCGYDFDERDSRSNRHAKLCPMCWAIVRAPTAWVVTAKHREPMAVRMTRAAAQRHSANSNPGAYVAPVALIDLPAGSISELVAHDEANALEACDLRAYRRRIAKAVAGRVG